MSQRKKIKNIREPTIRYCRLLMLAPPTLNIDRSRRTLAAFEGWVSSEMDLFWSRPRSFKMDRRSPLAYGVKAAVMSKLGDFLANYEDDVLSEYIIVLVCNGKHQAQARDDLEAFLGDQSADFVTWLWKHLSEEIRASMVSHGSLDHRADVNSCCRDVLTEDGRKHAHTLPDVLTHHAKSNEMNYESTNRTPNFEHPDTAAASDAFQHGHTTIGASSSEGNDDNAGDYIADDIPKYRSCVVRCSPNVEPVADFVEPLGHESQFQKPSHRSHSKSPCRSASSPEKGNVTIDDSQFGPLSIKRTTGKRRASVALDATPCQIRKPRGNVWDRLGKPCEGEGATLHRSLIGESSMLENNCAKRITDISNHHIGAFQGVDKLKPKSQFSKIVDIENTYSCSGSKGDYLHSRKLLPKLQKSLSTKNSRLQSLNEMIRKVPVTTANNLALGSSSAPSTSTVNKGDGPKLGSAKNEFSDVKSRLHQIETEMLELRSKKLCASNDKNFGIPPGVLNQSQEDIEARTVLVINVHFAASREDILSHFSICGVVLKVNILTNSMTARPKGAAYVVFAGKESVDKAILMTGTSFYSRILTVMRKADVPSEFSSQQFATGSVGKPVQPGHPQTPRTFSSQRKYVSTHLQWIRGQPANENCLPPQLNG